MDISCAFATSMATPDHVELAEQLSYRRAWLFDSPGAVSGRVDDPGLSAPSGRRGSGFGSGGAGPEPAPSDGQRGGHRRTAGAGGDPGRVAVAVGAGFTLAGAGHSASARCGGSEVADYVRGAAPVATRREKPRNGPERHSDAAHARVRRVCGRSTSRFSWPRWGRRAPRWLKSWPMACSRLTHPTPKRPRSAPGMRC